MLIDSINCQFCFKKLFLYCCMKLRNRHWWVWKMIIMCEKKLILTSKWHFYLLYFKQKSVCVRVCWLHLYISWFILTFKHTRKCRIIFCLLEFVVPVVTILEHIMLISNQFLEVTNRSVEEILRRKEEIKLLVKMNIL